MAPRETGFIRVNSKRPFLHTRAYVASTLLCIGTDCLSAGSNAGDYPPPPGPYRSEPVELPAPPAPTERAAIPGTTAVTPGSTRMLPLPETGADATPGSYDAAVLFGSAPAPAAPVASAPPAPEPDTASSTSAPVTPPPQTPPAPDVRLPAARSDVSIDLRRRPDQPAGYYGRLPPNQPGYPGYGPGAPGYQAYPPYPSAAPQFAPGMMPPGAGYTDGYGAGYPGGYPASPYMDGGFPAGGGAYGSYPAQAPSAPGYARDQQLPGAMPGGSTPRVDRVTASPADDTAQAGFQPRSTAPVRNSPNATTDPGNGPLFRPPELTPGN